MQNGVHLVWPSWLFEKYFLLDIQQTFSGSNTAGSFTTAVLNSFFSPLKNIPTVQNREVIFFFVSVGWLVVLGIAAL